MTNWLEMMNVLEYSKSKKAQIGEIYKYVFRTAIFKIFWSTILIIFFLNFKLEDTLVQEHGHGLQSLKKKVVGCSDYNGNEKVYYFYFCFAPLKRSANPSLLVSLYFGKVYHKVRC